MYAKRNMKVSVKITTAILIVSALVACQPQGSTEVESGKQRPNVVFIIADDLNTDLGSYGHPLVQSPNIDELAKASVVFERAYCQVPLCGPSRASMLTGKRPNEQPLLCNETSLRDVWQGMTTFPQLFRENGYYSARFGKIFHQGMPNKKKFVSLDDSLSWDAAYDPMGGEVALYETADNYLPSMTHYNFQYAQDSLHQSPHSDELVAEKTIDFLKSSKSKEAPFFLGVGFYRPHSPYIAPSQYFDLYDTADIMLPIDHVADTSINPTIAFAAVNSDLKFNAMTVGKKKEIIQAYYATISFMDDQVGKVIAALKEQDLYDNTIIVFTSDHGYALGEHGMWQKKSLYEKITKVPLMVKPVGNIPNGTRENNIVELLDIYPTLTEATGTTPPDYLDGISLFKSKSDRVATSMIGRVEKGKPFLRDAINCNMFVAGITYRQDSLRLTEWQDTQKSVELFNYTEDALEQDNVSKTAAYAEVRAWMGLD